MVVRSREMARFSMETYRPAADIVPCVECPSSSTRTVLTDQVRIGENQLIRDLRSDRAQFKSEVRCTLPLATWRPQRLVG